MDALDRWLDADPDTRHISLSKQRGEYCAFARDKVSVLPAHATSGESVEDALRRLARQIEMCER